VADRDLRVGRERELIHAARLAPLAQQPTEANRLGFTWQVNLR